MIDLSLLQRVLSHLHNATSVLFITGAGISADSGLPTYRGISGLYNSKETEEGFSIEEALSGEMFRFRPTITWKYIHAIESKCRGVMYNEAHKVIADFQDYFDRVCVLTQNIDHFHSDAGSKCVIEIHGDLHHLYCTQCSYADVVESYADLLIPPECPECHAIVRPNVVLFGEELPRDAVNQLRVEMEKGFDVVFTIGTSSVFPYIVEPIYWASSRGVPTIEINPACTAISSVVSEVIRERAIAALPELFIALKER